MQDLYIDLTKAPNIDEFYNHPLKRGETLVEVCGGVLRNLYNITDEPITIVISSKKTPNSYEATLIHSGTIEFTDIKDPTVSKVHYLYTYTRRVLNNAGFGKQGIPFYVSILQ